MPFDCCTACWNSFRICSPPCARHQLTTWSYALIGSCQ